MNIKRWIAAGACSSAAMVSMAAPASAQQNGLVNVYADDVNVQIPIGIAANICEVDVALLAQAADFSQVDCNAEGVALANNPNSGQGGPVNQRGLVNVALTDINVQVPVAVAANVCGVDVAVLASVIDAGSVDCEAAANAAGQ